MRRALGALLVCFGTCAAAPPAQQVRMVERKPDPHASPRPARGAEDVPPRTSVYLELEGPSNDAGDSIDPDSVTVRLQPEGGEAVEVLGAGGRFAAGASGWLRPKQGSQGASYRKADLLAVYVEPGEPLKPETTYTARVTAKSRGGTDLPEAAGTWRFKTAAEGGVRPLRFSIDLAAEPVHWQGRFFSGLCNVTFCSDSEIYGPTYELMRKTRERHPRAWNYQRDFWMTGMDHAKPGLSALPNVVRERETRRITAIEPAERGLRLRVEDFFGHEQYGIPSGRPVSEDYHPGDEVLIADGVHDARTKVVAADDAAATVLVEPVAMPERGWKIDYDGPLPTGEDPDAPGLFPRGGCYLRKFAPHGTPCYYWGRLEKEFDLVRRSGGPRLMVNFADAAGDLSRDGRNWTTAKDLARWHGAVRDITGHLIDRYGDGSLEFTWSVFNEPDLAGLFWRNGDWEELQRFYDYTADGVLRAFEDRGYDSDRVFIGGLELGGIFGIHLKLTEFLAHCSPTAEAKGALEQNAVYADRRLDGRRSKRVEELCRANGGKGSPCDFVSVHAYNGSETIAAKLIRAKEMALEMDPAFFADLWVNSHEACPEWNLPADQAARDSYLGNGYFTSWCADVTGRQLRKAAADPRYAFGETLLTVWPPAANFSGVNAVTRILHRDDDGDGRADAKVTVPYPEFHTLTLLSDFGDDYWVLLEQRVGGHVVAGFASRDERGVVRVLLYSHQGEDTQSRSDAEFDVSLDLVGLGGGGPVRVTEYRFDRAHNSYFREAKELAGRREVVPETEAAPLATALRAFAGDDPVAQRDALATLGGLGHAARKAAAAPLYVLALRTKDEGVRSAIRELSDGGFFSETYSTEEVERVQELAELRSTAESTVEVASDGAFRLTARVAGNGVNVLVIERGER